VRGIEQCTRHTAKRLNDADSGWIEPKLVSRRSHLLSTDLIKLRHLVGNPWATVGEVAMMVVQGLNSSSNFSQIVAAGSPVLAI